MSTPFSSSYSFCIWMSAAQSAWVSRVCRRCSNARGVITDAVRRGFVLKLTFDFYTYVVASSCSSSSLLSLFWVLTMCECGDSPRELLIYFLSKRWFISSTVSDRSLIGASIILYIKLIRKQHLLFYGSLVELPTGTQNLRWILVQWGGLKETLINLFDCRIQTMILKHPEFVISNNASITLRLVWFFLIFDNWRIYL